MKRNHGDHNVWYRDWLQAGRPRGRSSSLGKLKNFLFSTSSRSVVGPNQLPILWVPGLGQPVHEADHSPPSNADLILVLLLLMIFTCNYSAIPGSELSDSFTFLTFKCTRETKEAIFGI
jgi:hypothetical protein